MLVLTRRAGESIVIGNNVVVTVLEVRGDQVRVGVDAPRSIQVHREEVYLKVQEANAAAVASASPDARQRLLRQAARRQQAEGGRGTPGASTRGVKRAQSRPDSADE